jgi:hypothetical protein
MKRVDPADAETVREFRERQATTFRHARLWIALTAIGFVGVFAFNKRLDDFRLFLFFCAPSSE